MEIAFKEGYTSKGDSNATITKVSKIASYDGKTDVIRSVTVECQLTVDGTTYSKEIQLYLEEPSSDFKAYDTLTKLDVVNFIGGGRYVDATTNAIRELEREHLQVEESPPWL